MSTIVCLGNRAALSWSRNDKHDLVSEKLPGKRCTTVTLPDGVGTLEAVRTITDPGGVWGKHADEGAKPAWVASDNPRLAELLAEHFGGIEVRDLEVQS